LGQKLGYDIDLELFMARWLSEEDIVALVLGLLDVVFHFIL